MFPRTAPPSPRGIALAPSARRLAASVGQGARQRRVHPAPRAAAGGAPAPRGDEPAPEKTPEELLQEALSKAQDAASDAETSLGSLHELESATKMPFLHRHMRAIVISVLVAKQLGFAAVVLVALLAVQRSPVALKAALSLAGATALALNGKAKGEFARVGLDAWLQLIQRGPSPAIPIEVRAPRLTQPIAQRYPNGTPALLRCREADGLGRCGGVLRGRGVPLLLNSGGVVPRCLLPGKLSSDQGRRGGQGGDRGRV